MFKSNKKKVVSIVDCTPKEELIKKIRAGYSHFLIYSLEPRRAERLIMDILREHTAKSGYQFQLANVWDVTQADSDGNSVTLMQALEEFNKMKRRTVLIVRNFSMPLDNPDDRNEIVQMLSNSVDDYQSQEGRKLFFALTIDKTVLPRELERDFVIHEFPLPNENELGVAVDLICESTGRTKLVDDVRDLVIQSLRGMTYDEAKNALSLALVQSGDFDTQVIARQRATMIEKIACLEYAEFSETFDDIIGHDVIKDFYIKTHKSKISRGMMLLGPTGTGKTLFGQAAGNYAKLPVIVLSFDKVYQKFYGESEKVINAAIAVIKAIGSCIVFVDEFEKGAGGASNKSGMQAVEERTLGAWLKFMQNRPEGVYIIATCNDISKLPPEYLRSERWDCIFYVQMPDSKQLEAIFEYYKKYYNVNGVLPIMDGWTGSDIKTCCRIAHMTGVGVKDAANFVTPTGKIKAKEIAQLEKTATNYVLATSKAVGKVVKKSRTILREVDD